MMRKSRLSGTRAAVVGLLVMVLAAGAGCGDGADSVVATIETVSAAEAYEIIESAPPGLVIMDVRTEDEFL